MLLFALGTNLTILYMARIIGGMLSAAVLPIAAAFVADMTSEQDRARGMTWLGSATSFGVVLGPALGAFLSKWGIQRAYSFGYFRIDDFSIPFFSASILAFVALGAAIRWFPESLNRPGGNMRSDGKGRFRSSESDVKPRAGRRWIGPLLALAFLNYFALAVFEGTFALHAKALINFGAFEMGWIFMVCGLVMAVSQGTFVPTLIGRFGEAPLLPMGFIMMGAGLAFLMIAEHMASVLVFVALFALGVALITPTVASMVSKWAGSDVGKALGQSTAANSLGQAAGPMAGGFMIGWQVHTPYLLTSLHLGIAAFSTLLFIRRNGH